MNRKTKKRKMKQHIIKAFLVLAALFSYHAAQADNVIFSTDFTGSDWTGQEITAGSTINGIYFNAATFAVSSTGLEMNTGNANSTRFFAIRLSGVNGRVDVSVGNGNARARICYAFSEGTEISSNGGGISSSNTPSQASTAGEPTTFSYTMSGSGTDLVMYLGRQGSSYTNITDITVTTPDASGGTKTAVSLAFDSPTTFVTVGNTVTNTATTTPSGITGVTYTSNNTKVATVGYSTGVVTGVAEGTATITAAYAGDDTHYAATSVTYQITVMAQQDKEDVSLYFDDELTTTVAVGASVTNAAVCTPSVSPLTYSSSNESVATVDANGRVTGVAEGSTTITVAFAGNDLYNAATDSYTLTVTAATEPATLTAVSNYTFTFNGWESATLTKNVINDNLEVAASSAKTVQIKAQTGTADNIAFTKAASMGGAGSSEGRYVHIKVEAGTKVTAYGTTGKNGTERTLNIATGTLDNVVATILSSSTSTIASGSIECDEATDVYVYSAGSGMTIYGIKVETTGSQGGGESEEVTVTPATEGTAITDEIAGAVAQDNNASQLCVETIDGSIYYYNTADIADVTLNEEMGIVNVQLKNGSTDTYNGTVRNLSVAKAAEQEQGGEVSGTLTITEAKGWYESAYVKFTPVSGATSYNVYVKGGQYSSYTKIDAELVRNYGSYGRADVVGLKAGTYSMKVVAVSGSTETQTYGEATGLSVRNYQRDGFAHKDFSGVGAYNDDGTLKSNAKVFYITSETAKTITTDVVTSSKGAVTTCTGWQTIIDAYQKGYDTTPIAFRVIGTIRLSDLDHISSSAEGLQIKGNKAYSPLNYTVEGIGDDATIHGFGLFMRNASSIELRNLGVMWFMDDGISIDTDNSHVWMHNIDIFYGQPGSAADQKKGDGSIDMKGDSQYITLDHVHFWDSGKMSLCGMKSESGPNYITYHHNWFDHSDSRHPRVRTMSVHVWNNYFDGVSKYGVGVTFGASAFVDRNYFRNTKNPMLSSRQGTDAKGDGTFSGENGGIIKSYGNVMTGVSTSTYIPHTKSSTSFDAYEATSLSETVPATYKALAGGTTYNNFDTNASLMYSYTPDRASDVPSVVTGYWGAGRLNHGDFQWTFSNSSEDGNFEVIQSLQSAVRSYTPTLVGGF